ncbi:hypothetical protein NUH30_19025 [Leptospira sp. 85282-16]|uniref:hypothetical protein n=1 Tax=Leptospira sp. 85282-16 TaxID=2971256 RepID=UPI0021C08F0C|nr:hypothetical protein [Leptospira sp. 85282-16]MCT8335787.1 hypothetical protein [Leptospira sp. 85282-16]
MKTLLNKNFKSILIKFTLLYLIYSVIDYQIIEIESNGTETENFKLIENIFGILSGIYLINLMYITFKKKENNKKFRFFIIELFLVFLLAKIIISIIMFLLYNSLFEKYQYTNQLYIENYIRSFLEYISFSIILTILLNNQQITHFFTKLKILFLNKKMQFCIIGMLFSNLIYISISQEIHEQQILLFHFANYLHFLIQFSLIYIGTILLFDNETHTIPYGA